MRPTRPLTPSGGFLEHCLWIIQIVLAMAFAVAGLTKLLRSREQPATSMGWVEDSSPAAIRSIGIAELLAAMGLILPGLTGTVARVTRGHYPSPRLSGRLRATDLHPP